MSELIVIGTTRNPAKPATSITKLLPSNNFFSRIVKIWKVLNLPFPEDFSNDVEFSPPSSPYYSNGK
jgi:hypothetical protein